MATKESLRDLAWAVTDVIEIAPIWRAGTDLPAASGARVLPPAAIERRHGVAHKTLAAVRYAFLIHALAGEPPCNGCV